MNNRFNPAPNILLSLLGDQYLVEEHPAAPALAFAAEGKRGTVYKLTKSDGSAWALKVFAKRYRDADPLRSTKLLNGLDSLPGLQSATRLVIKLPDSVARSYPELENAILMRWVPGVTFFDLFCIAEARKTCVFDETVALVASRQFLSVMLSLEERGLRFPSVNSGNVMFDQRSTTIQLIGLERLYLSQADHGFSANHIVGQEDDQSAAVLATEALLLGNPRFGHEFTDEGYLRSGSPPKVDSARWQNAIAHLSSFAPRFSELLQRLSTSRNPNSTISIRALHDAIQEAVTIQLPISSLGFTESRRLRVFLCHASENKKDARELSIRLRQSGMEPWLDEEELLPGQDWEREIRRAISRADVVLVCLSRSSISKEGYVQKEIKQALDIADEKPDGTIFVIPARLEPCQVPERLSRLQWVDLFEDRAEGKLFRALFASARKRGIS